MLSIDPAPLHCFVVDANLSSHLLVSQDQDEIYLTFASYDQSVVLELSEDWGANSQLPQNGVIWPLERK